MIQALSRAHFSIGGYAIATRQTSVTGAEVRTKIRRESVQSGLVLVTLPPSLARDVAPQCWLVTLPPNSTQGK